MFEIRKSIQIIFMVITIGMNYRVLEYENFELNGYTPDVICNDGEDAMIKALNIEFCRTKEIAE